MPTKLSQKANDQSTFVITVSFFDEDGDPVTPNIVQWSLRNENDAIINDRELEDITVPDDTLEIVLSGDDLKYSEGALRALTIYATYDSTLGNDLPLNDEVTFYIANLRGV